MSKTKVCWVTYMKKAGMFAIFSQENDDAPAKCECAFDCYPTATRYTGTRIESVDSSILYAIDELIENGYVFIGII